MKSSRYSANPRRVPIINTNRDVTEDEYTKTSGSTHFRSSPLVRLASIPHAILEVAVQDCGDYVSAARQVETSRGLGENCITDLEFVSRHGAIEY
jgi:hypothetical protein